MSVDVEIVDEHGQRFHVGGRVHVAIDGHGGTVPGRVHDLIESDEDHHPLLLVEVDAEIVEFSCPQKWSCGPSTCSEVVAS